MTTLYNPTPWEIIREDFLNPLNISVAQFAKDAGFTEEETQNIITEQLPINAQISQKLNTHFKSTFDWVGMWKDYEFFEVINTHKKRIVKYIREIEKMLRTHANFKVQFSVGLHLSNVEFIAETEYTIRLLTQILKTLAKKQQKEYVKSKNTLHTLFTELKELTSSSLASSA